MKLLKILFSGVLTILFSFSLQSFSAAGEVSLDDRIYSLTEAAAALENSFFDAHSAYLFVSETILADGKLPAHEKAFRRYLPSLILAQKDISEVRRLRDIPGNENMGADVIPVFKDSMFPVFESEKFYSAYENLSALYEKNSENIFVGTFFGETSALMLIDYAFAGFQSALGEFEKLEPEIISTVNDLASNENTRAEAALLAVDLLALSYRFNQNTRVITHYNQFENLMDSLDDTTTLEAVYSVMIYSCTAAGDYAAAAMFQEKLNALRNPLLEAQEQYEQEVMRRDVMYESAKSFDFAEDQIAGSLYMPDSIGASTEEMAEPEFNYINLKVSNISQVNFERLLDELSYSYEIAGIDQETFEMNTASVRIATTYLDAPGLISLLNKLEFKEFVLNSIETVDAENIAALALGVPTRKFNVMLPVFEYISLPDDPPDTALMLEILAEAQKAETASPDPLRKILYMNYGAFLRRLANVPHEENAARPAGENTAAEFPLLTGFYYAQTGLALSDAGNYKKSLESFHAAQGLVGASSDIATVFPGLVRTTRANLLSVSLSAGKYDSADNAAATLEELISSSADDSEILNLKIALANYLYAGEDYDSALSRFEEAGVIAESYEGIDDVLALVKLGAGNCAMMKRDHGEAEKAFTAAAGLAEESGVMLLAARAYSHLGRVRLFQGNYSGAAESSERAFALASDFEDSELKWESLFTLARAQEGQDMLNAALETYLSATGLIESAAEPDQAGNPSETQDVYTYAVALCARMNRPETALQLLERGNSMALRNQFEKSSVIFKNSEKNDAAEKLGEYQEKISAIENNIKKQAGEKQTGATAPAMDELKKDLHETQRDYIKYISGLESTNSELASLYKIEPIELVKIRNKLPDDLAVIYYLVAEEKLYVFYVRADSLGFREVEIDSGALGNLVKMLRHSYSEPGAAKNLNSADGGEDGNFKTAVKLYEILISPIEANLEGINKLAIIPNGALNFVPFQALVSPGGDGKFLVEKYSVFYLDTLSALRDENESPDMTGASLFAFGNADETLPAAENEVNSISGIFSDSQVFIRGKASEKTAKNVSESGGFYHFATHGKLDFKDISRSYILLASDPGDGEDGKLTIEEIWGYWWGDSRLVVLSACNTAMGDLSVRGKAVHPASAFLNAGAPSVMATLWSVDDAATAELMDDFYKKLSTMSKADALRAAQLALLGNPRTAHPFYWAPFMLIGDWR